MVEPRTYTGWKAGLAIVGVTFAVFAALNLLARATRTEPRDVPRPVVTTVSPLAP